MTERRIRLTATAARHVERERAWWIKNRDHLDVFATQLESAMRILAILPGAGTPYLQTPVPDLRRLYMRRVSCHVYYTFNDEEVTIRAVWGARRKQGPDVNG